MYLIYVFLLGIAVAILYNCIYIMELGLPYSFHFWKGESEGETFLFIVALALAVAAPCTKFLPYCIYRISYTVYYKT